MIGENEGAVASDGWKGGVDSRAREGNRRTVVVVAATGIETALARKITLNSLIMRVTLGGTMLLGSFTTTLTLILSMFGWRTLGFGS